MSGPETEVGPDGSCRTVVGSGLRVVTERVPGARSVSVGVYVGVGSRDEPDELAGASHFLEHLLFKGTPTRSALDIAMAVDAVGGEINAYTGREATAYYVRLPASQLDLGLDLLSDVVANPAFRAHEVEAERDVIVEELLMSEDDPDDVVHKALYEAAFCGHGLGRETLGTMDSIGGLGRDSIAAFHAQRYRPANLVVAAAGDLDHDHVVDTVGALCANGVPGAPPERSAPVLDADALTVVDRDTEQVHLEFAWRCPDVHDPDRYPLLVGNHVLGGGMASRLFQEVREERGLSYGIYTSPALYSDAGLVVLSVSTAPARLAELLEVIDATIEALLDDGITETEHRVALGYLEGATLLGLEDTGSRMGRLASNELVFGSLRSVDEHLEAIRAVTRDDVSRVLRSVFDTPRVVAAVGDGASSNPLLERAAGWRR